MLWHRNPFCITGLTLPVTSGFTSQKARNAALWCLLCCQHDHVDQTWWYEVQDCSNSIANSLTVLYQAIKMFHSPKSRTSLCKGEQSRNLPSISMTSHSAAVMTLRLSTEGAISVHLDLEPRNSSTSPSWPLPLPVIHWWSSEIGWERRSSFVLLSSNTTFSWLIPSKRWIWKIR